MSHALPNIGKPATNALKSIDVTSLEQVSVFSKDGLLKLHGVGPKAVETLQKALSDNGLTFSSSEAHPYGPDFLLLGDLSCDNAPKRRVIRDFVIGLWLGNKSQLEETANQEIHVEINGEQSLNGLDELADYLLKHKVKLSSLNLISILSHGKYGAADGVAVTTKGETIHFGSFYTFENTKKEALIKEIRLYLK